MKLVRIPKGKFVMGSSESEKGHRDDETQHEVKISLELYIGVYELTQDQWTKVMGSNPSRFKVATKQIDSGNHPVEKVSWGDAVEFCERLSRLPEEKEAERVYRLPTEAEWEYACRAGKSTPLNFGEPSQPAEQHMWFFENSDNITNPVGLKKPNAWGLYDMHGNVWEWCSDLYGEYPKGVETDPTGQKNGDLRVIRGGGWDSGIESCRSAARIALIPIDRGNGNNGFRVVMRSPKIAGSEVASPPPQPRVWTSKDGKFKVEAKLLETAKDSIQIERVDNGNVVSVLIEKLSAADQAYIKQHPTASENPLKPMDENQAGEVVSTPVPESGAKRFQVPNYGSVPDFGPEHPWSMESQSPLRIVVNNPGIKTSPGGGTDGKGRASVTVERPLKTDERVEFVKSTEERLKKLMVEFRGRETAMQSEAMDPKESPCRIHIQSFGIYRVESVTYILFQEDKTIVIESIFQGLGSQWEPAVKTAKDIYDVIIADKGWLPKSSDPNKPILRIPGNIQKEIQAAASRIIELVDQDKIRELLEEFISPDVKEKIYTNEAELAETIERFKSEGKPKVLRELMKTIDWDFATYSEEKQEVKFSDRLFTFRRVDGKWTFQ